MRSAITSDAIPEGIQAATRQIAERDPAMAACIDRVGPCRIRPGQGDYFSALVRAITYQQLAGRAAAAIHGRFIESIGGTVSPEAVAATPQEALRAAGMSAAKTCRAAKGRPVR